ncbi:MAG: TonB-dependent receptor [Terracidiphilus sp.]
MTKRYQFFKWGFRIENSGSKPAEAMLTSHRNAARSVIGHRNGVAMRLVLSCALLLLFALPLAAQNADLAGTVRDSSGAVVPGATLSLKNVATGVVLTRTTDGQGIYAFPSIQPGLYDVGVTAQGFQSQIKNGIDLHVADNVAVNFSLKVGSISTTVNVRVESAQMLETADAATGQVVDRDFVDSMPLISRSATDLAFLAPGVTQPQNSTYGSSGGSSNNFISDGSRAGASDILIDGITTQQQNTGGQTITIAYTPSVDAVEEFKVQQTNFSAEYGRTGATITNLITRSGTNKFHGSAYDYLRNKIFDANNFFAKQANVPLPPLHQDIFGGTVGGPVFKKRTFFFFDYDGLRSKAPAFYQYGVASDAEKKGDFGEICTGALDPGAGGMFDANGECSNANGQLWDPFYNTSLDSGGNPVRTSFIPFNNMGAYVSPGITNPPAGYPYTLPTGAGNLMDPVSVKMIQGFPEPNIGKPGQPNYNPYINYAYSGASTSNNDQWDLKIDHHFSDTNNISARYSHRSSPTVIAPCFPNSPFDPCTQGPTPNTAHLASLNYNHVFNNTTVISLNYGVTRTFYGAPGISGDFPSMDSAKDQGMPSYMDDSGIKGYPAINFGSGGAYAAPDPGGNNVSIGSTPWNVYKQGQDSQLASAKLSYLRGRHEMTFGVDYRFHHFNFGQEAESNGYFSYAYMGTSQNGWVGGGGDPMASFLIGSGANWGFYNIPAYLATSNSDWAAFAQDNFRVTSKLTVNAGLRYDLTIPMTERYNKLNNLNLTATSSFAGGGFESGLTFPGGPNASDPKSRGLYDINPTNFSPRFGLAYELNNKTVVRSGYGIYYAVSPASASADVNNVQGFASYTSWVGFWNDGHTPSGMLRNPFPNGILPPIGSSQGLLTNIGGSAIGPVRSFNSVPYEQSWSLEVQRSLPWGLLTDASYIGKKGTRLLYGISGLYNYNHLSDSIIGSTPAEVAALVALVPNPNGAEILKLNPTSSIGVNVPAYWSQLPYQQFQNVDVVAPPWASANYNALQLRAQKSISNGLTFLVTYVWSKSIDDTSEGGNGNGTSSIVDPNRIDFLERSISQFNIPQVFQFSYTYELPFGQGKLLGARVNSVVDGFIGGWQTNGIWRFDNGQPLQPSLYGGSLALPTFGQRPQETAPLKRASKGAWKPLNPGCPISSCSYYANSSVIQQPANYTFGNVPKTIPLTAPGTANASLSIFKSFGLSWIREGSSLEFRLEAFNAFNHTQFAAPNAVVGDAANFGKVTSQANQPRQAQVALKFYY